MQTQRIKVNLVPNADIPERIHVSQYDKGSRALEFELFDGPIAYSVPDGATVTIQGTKPDNSGFQYECTLSGGTISCIVQGQMTAVAGDVTCEIVIAKGGSILGTANFAICVEPSALSDDTIVSETDMPMVAKAAEAAANAKDLANSVSEYDKNVQDLSDKVKDIPDQLKTIQSAVSNADASATAAAASKADAEQSAAAAAESAEASQSAAQDIVDSLGLTVLDGMLAVEYEE